LEKLKADGGGAKLGSQMAFSAEIPITCAIGYSAGTLIFDQMPL